MKITYVKQSHVIGNDDMETVDVVSQSTFDQAGKGWNTHLGEHDSWINDAIARMDRIESNIRTAKGESVAYVDGRINRLREIGREVLVQILNETLVSKLDLFSEQISKLREERDNLREEREVTKREVSELKGQIAVLQEQLSETTKLAQKIRGDFAPQVAEFKVSIPVPKKYVQFLSIKTTEPQCIKEN